MRWILTLFAIFSACLAYCNPTGHHVVSGDAQVTYSGNACHIHAKDQAVIHWQDFSIGVGELTRFIQPSENSIVLNRVTSELPSEILGALHANGKLFLLNPNGILFGENAVVNVADLIASTLNLSDEDFLRGETLHFHGPSKATIINHGTIRAATGNVTLFSRQIIDTGTIQAPQGRVELAAATEIFLQPNDKKRVLIRPTKGEKSEAGIYHQGKIEALEAYLQADGNLYDLAIKEDGEIDALTFKAQGGRIYLCAEEGSVAISGKMESPQGTITALGKHVFILDDAHLSVSDRNKAGTIHIGKGSDFTFVAENAHLEANALKLGPGGNIYCTSDGTSLFLGHAEVRGGLYGGHGGFIEVSGAESTIFHGTTDRFASFGKSGKLLLDPEANFKISTAFNYNYEGFPDVKPTKDIANLTIDVLLSELQKGPVTIQTGFDGEGGMPGYIQLCSDISHTYDSPHSLTLYSTGSEGILWNGSLINTGRGNIELLAMNGAVHLTPSDPLTPAFIQTAGNICIQTPKAFQITGAHQQLAGLKTTSAGQISIQAKEPVTLTSCQKAPALIHVENGHLLIDTPGAFTLHGRGNTPAELRSTGTGNITLIRTDAIQIHAESGPALISFSHRYGDLLIDSVNQGIELNAIGDTAAIEGGTGSITLKNIGSDINLLAEKGPASIFGIGSVNIQTHGNIHLDALENNATIGSHHLVQITSEKSLLLTAENGNASIVSPQGMMVHVYEDTFLNGTSNGQALFCSPNSHFFTGHDLTLFSNAHIHGSNGPLLISIGNDLIMSNPLTVKAPSILGTELNMNIGHNLYIDNDSLLRSDKGPLTLSIGDTAYFDHSSRITAYGGPLSIQTLQGNIHFSQFSAAHSNNDAVTLSAGKSVIVEGFSHIESHGNKGMTIVVDCTNPNSIGKGGFVLGHNASLSSGHAPLEIYTAKRTQNAINGTLNGFRLAAAPLYVNTKEEQWGIFFPELSLASTSYTVFHKENGLILLSPQGVTQKEFTRIVVNFTGPFTAELFRDLHPYNEYTADSESFIVTYPQGAIPEEDTFSIKRPTFRHRSVPSITN